MLQFGQSSPLAPQISGLRGTDFAAWTLAAFTISVRAGALIRRMIPGIAAAITAWSGLLAGAVFWLHSHYQAPLTGARHRGCGYGPRGATKLIGRRPTTEARLASVNHYLDANEILADAHRG
jgi:hypothetical protein